MAVSWISYILFQSFISFTSGAHTWHDTRGIILIEKQYFISSSLLKKVLFYLCVNYGPMSETQTTVFLTLSVPTNSL